MSDYGPLDLDEHAAFWARDNARMGESDGRVEFEIEGRKFVARTRRADYIAGAKNSRPSFNTMCALEESNAVFVAPVLLKKRRRKAPAIEISHAFRPFCPAPEASPFCARLFWNGTGIWFSRKRGETGDLSFVSEGVFRCSTRLSCAEFFALPQTDFLDDCREQWQTEHSEMRRAHDFLMLSSGARDQYACQCEVGDIEELRALTIWIGQRFWSVVPELAQTTLTLNLYWANPHVQALDIADFYRLKNFYQKWRAAVLHVCKPKYIGHFGNPNWIEQHLSRQAPLRLNIERPTHHEQIEAHATLRDWAKLHLNEAQQRELFDLPQ